jgi:signal transduction histidine kinase
MIREHPRFQRTAIIFVSAIHLTDPDRLRGYAAGAVDYLPVPVVPELMRAKVKVFAELYRKTRELEQLNAELEQRVAERTAELELANALLEQRVEERTREREAALAQLHEMQKMESLGQLTGGVAHDFNNLLTAVMANLELLKKRLPDDPKMLRLVDGAMAGAERGATLTKRMLAFARRQELKPTTVQLSSLIQGMDEMLRRSLGPTIAIGIGIDESLPPVLVDPNQLELGLLNLALNARDAMPDGGQLTIEAQRQNEHGVGRPDGGYVRISVTDSGTGMDAETLKRATEPFFTTKGVGKGTGLGLSMVQGLVAQSGGTMQIDSRPGRGTSVRVWLPVAETDVPAAERGIIDPGHRSAKSGSQVTLSRRIMLVDDDPLILSSTRAILEDLGHTVIVASSAAEALEKLLDQSTVDVVVTDYAMPIMNGSELATTIRQRWPQMPIILASAYADHIGLEHNRFERLSKPYTQAEIASPIDQALRARKFTSRAGNL